MDLQDLKNVWVGENINATPEISLDKQKEIRLPLEKIRKNMRMEFWFTLALFVFIILYMAIANFHDFKFKIYAITLVGTMMLVTCFYFSKFFLLYKNLTDVNLNVLENLKDLKFQFKLNEQYYLAFYIAFAPFVVGEAFLIFQFVPNFKELEGVAFIGSFLLFCAVLLIFLYVVGKWWFFIFYGKYFNNINKITDEFK